MRVTILSVLVVLFISACAQRPGFDTSFDSHPLADMQATIWVDPDGCQHWVIDDGIEGYMSPRLRPDGRPYCDGPELSVASTKVPPRVTKQGFVGTSAATTAEPPVYTSAPQSGFTFVQIATFSNPANAAVAQREFEALGFKVRQAPMRNADGTVMIRVLIETFGGSADVARGLQAARSNGYTDAFPVQG